jgi:hypothetical protein
LNRRGESGCSDVTTLPATLRFSTDDRRGSCPATSRSAIPGRTSSRSRIATWVFPFRQADRTRWMVRAGGQTGRAAPGRAGSAFSHDHLKRTQRPEGLALTGGHQRTRWHTRVSHQRFPHRIGGGRAAGSRVKMRPRRRGQTPSAHRPHRQLNHSPLIAGVRGMQILIGAQPKQNQAASLQVAVKDDITVYGS